MRIRSPLLCGLLMAATLLTPALAAAGPAILYVIRHAEKAPDEKDPDLTAKGKARAQNIAAVLHTAGIGHIYSTATARTRQTAQPLATRLGLEVQMYDPAKAASVVGKVKGLEGSALLVGHSNTVPELVRLLGGQPGTDIADDEFDRLYQLITAGDGSVTTVLLHSVAP